MAARADIDAVATGISRAFTEYGAEGRQFRTVGLQGRRRVREIRPSLIVLFAAVGLLALIACVNVASPARCSRRRSGQELGAFGRARGQRGFACFDSVLPNRCVLSVCGAAAGHRRRAIGFDDAARVSATRTRSAERRAC